MAIWIFVLKASILNWAIIAKVNINVPWMDEKVSEHIDLRTYSRLKELNVSRLVILG